MTQSIPVETSHRLAGLTPQERAVLQYSLVSLADSVLADAEAEDIARDDLAAAGSTFLQATTLAFELDDLAGVEHPPLEFVQLMAETIAEGDAPLAAKMAREAVADDDGRPLPGDLTPLGPGA